MPLFLGCWCWSLFNDKTPFPGTKAILTHCLQAGLFFFFFLKPWRNVTLICLMFFVFCCCSVAKLCPILWNSTNCSTPGFLVFYHLLEFTKTHVHWVRMQSLSWQDINIKLCWKPCFSGAVPQRHLESWLSG